MARKLLFGLAFLVMAHYVVLGTGDIGLGDVGGHWRIECMTFLHAVGFGTDWQLRLTWGGPAVLLSGVVMLWAVCPRR